MIEKITFVGHNGYLAMDEDSKQGIFAYYYPPSKKVVLFEVYIKKKGDMKLAYPGRHNLNVNIRPAIAKEVMEIIATVAGITSPTPDKKAGVVTAGHDIRKDIKELGGV